MLHNTVIPVPYTRSLKASPRLEHQASHELPAQRFYSADYGSSMKFIELPAWPDILPHQETRPPGLARTVSRKGGPRQGARSARCHDKIFCPSPNLHEQMKATQIRFAPEEPTLKSPSIRVFNILKTIHAGVYDFLFVDEVKDIRAGLAQLVNSVFAKLQHVTKTENLNQTELESIKAILDKISALDDSEKLVAREFANYEDEVRNLSDLNDVLNQILETHGEPPYSTDEKD